MNCHRDLDLSLLWIILSRFSYLHNKRVGTIKVGRGCISNKAELINFRCTVKWEYNHLEIVIICIGIIRIDSDTAGCVFISNNRLSTRIWSFIIIYKITERFDIASYQHDHQCQYCPPHCQSSAHDITFHARVALLC